MKRVYQIDSNGFYVTDVLLADDKSTPSECVEIDPPQDGSIHIFKWDGTKWVEGKSDDDLFQVAKANKLTQLQADLGKSLYQGFTSNADGTSGLYAIDPSAMGKWTGTLSNINAGAVTSVNLKDFNGNRVTLDATQFKQMASDGFNFFQGQEQKLWDAEDKVNAIQLANYSTVQDAINAVDAVTL